MKKILGFLLAVFAVPVWAQFVPGQVLTAAQLNSQFALYAPLLGAVFSGPVTIPNLTISSGVTLPAGSVPLTRLSSQAANTVVANATGAGASPIAFSMPSCSTSSSALQWASGTGFSCGTAFALTTANTFTGNQTLSFSSPAVNISDTSGSGTARVSLQNNGTNVWALVNDGPTALFSVRRYVSGTLTDQPLTIANATGAVTMVDGITGSPISGSTGSFTTLAASSTVSGTGFSTYLASPPAIGGTAANTGKFATLQSTGTFTPSTTSGIVGTTLADNANAGSVGEYVTATASAVSLPAAGTVINCTSISLTAGDWDVTGVMEFSSGTGVTMTFPTQGISTTSATLGALGTYNTIVNGPPATNNFFLNVPVVRVNVSTTTPTYLVASAVSSGGTSTGSCVIRARRVR